MSKSWRLTAIFGVLFALCAGVYFFSTPPATTPFKDSDVRVLPVTADQVLKIEVQRKEGTLAFERTSDSLGEYWRVAGGVSHPAEPSLVQQMLYGLDRFLKSGALDPGRPEAAPDLTGLAEPRLTVSFTAASGREVLKFGKSPAANTTVVCYQRQGDPKVYLVSVDTFEAFNKPALSYRAKVLARYAPHRVNKVILEAKFLRPQGKGKPVLPEYERSVMERFEEGLERGWYLTSPHRERLDDHSVAKLVTELSRLEAGGYQPVGSLREKGFDQPEAKVSIFSAGDDPPIEIAFGASAEREKKRWVRLGTSPEAGLCEMSQYEDLPLQRNYLRVRALFAFSHELVRRLQIDAPPLGKVVLERREFKKPDEVVSTSKWTVVSPEGLKVESERLEAFVAAVVSQEVETFLGKQDFKQAGLDPAPIRLTIETREGKTHVCGFSPAGYLRKEGIDEVFQVRTEFVRLLQRLELNFIDLDMVNIPRQSLREFGFESRVSAELQPIYYRLKHEPEKPWVFIDPVHKDAPVDPGRVDDLLTMLNFIKAESLIGRDPATVEKYRLDETTAPATLRIVHETGEGKESKLETTELFISDDLSGKPAFPMYYARLKDNMTVFQIPALLVTSLKQVPVLKK